MSFKTLTLNVFVSAVFGVCLCSLSSLSVKAAESVSVTNKVNVINAQIGQTETETVARKDKIITSNTLPEDADIVSPQYYSKDALDNLYALSRTHNQCQTERINARQALQDARHSIDVKLDSIEDDTEAFASLVYVHQLGLISAQETLQKINQTLLDKVQAKYAAFTWMTKSSDLPELQAAMIEKYSEIAEALRNDNLGAIPQLLTEFRAISPLKGFVARIRNKPHLIDPDIIIGHFIVDKTLDEARTLLAQIDVTHTMLAQAIRSKGDAQLIRIMLSEFEFTNEFTYTKHQGLQTPLQAAIAIRNYDVIELLLAFPKLKNMRYTSSPVNTLLAQVLKREPQEQALDEQEVAILKLLARYDYGADIVQNERRKSLGLAGYLFSTLPKELVRQLREQSIPAKAVNGIGSPAVDKLDRALKTDFDERVNQHERLTQDYEQKLDECNKIAQTFKAVKTHPIYITNVKPYLKSGLSFSEQVDYLATISPALVDAFYDYDLEQTAQQSELDKVSTFVDSIDINGDFDGEIKNNKARVEQLDIGINLRHELAQQLCEKFGEPGVYASFEISQFIHLRSYDTSECISRLDNYSTSLQEAYYAAPDTFPSAVYTMIKYYEYDKTVDYLQASTSISKDMLEGYPKGRDALMLALARKNGEFYKSTHFKYYELLHALLAVTELNDLHMQRLHSLKVADIIMFEALSKDYPQILSAVNYPFDIYVYIL